MIKIHTTYIYPSVPIRFFDWSAVTDDYDGPGSPIGYGPTEQDAIAELIQAIEEAQHDNRRQ